MKADVDPKSGLAGRPIDRPETAARPAGVAIVRSRLFVKYVALLIVLVVLALLANSAFEVWFSYQEQKASLVTIEHEQAQAAADKIGEFVTQIQSQLGWTTQLPGSADTLEQRRFDALRLLRQEPAVTELAQVDVSGHEQLKVSRLAMDVIGSGADWSKKPEYIRALAHKIYYSPVYFRRQSEPYMTIALAGARTESGVSIAQVNLKLIWDVVSNIKVGEHGLAYVVDGNGRLIAHPDISLVLRNTDMSRLTQVRSALAGPGAEQVQEASDLAGHKVLTAFAPVAPLRWIVFVETPMEEAYAPLHASIQRTGFILLGALALAFIAGMFLAGRMVGPIQALRAGAARIGAGDLSQRIAIKTGDEVEALADQFNDMACRLQESYANLENKVEQRTRELSEALEQQTATSEVLKVISASPGELEPVFQAILANAVRLCEAKFGNLFLVVQDNELMIAAMHGAPSEFQEAFSREPMVSRRNGPAVRVVQTKSIVHIADLSASANEAFSTSRVAKLAGARTLIGVPMLKDDVVVGVIAIYRQEVRLFTDKQIELVQNFAAQAVIAIENARLLGELRQRTDELARSVEELRALGEVSQAVNSTLDLQTVLDTIVSKAVQLSQTEAGAIYAFDDVHRELQLRSTYGMTPEMIDAVRHRHIGVDDPNVAPAITQREPAQIADLEEEPSTPLNEIILRAGFRALLVAPLIHGEEIAGVLVVRRKAPGAFGQNAVELMKTFAAQSALAIQNAGLFNVIADKGRQLEIASKHKSQFLANMSHELRTPLNAILGYTELILDNIYGEAPERMRTVQERVQANGKHLLGLINDVLDLSKIEAGQLTLSLNDYSIHDMAQSVHTAVEPLANGKKLAFTIDVPANLPTAHGDERRLAQVLLNLVGNAIKFTDAGEVAVTAAAANGAYTISVRDTGPGIAAEDQTKIFEEFQQADNSQTKTKGGTGLGLSIAKRIVEMHGGRLWVESRPEHGSTFSFTVPLRVQRDAGQS